MSRKLNYPPRPWRDGQIARLQAGIDFAYSFSMKKWVPITPGFESTQQIQSAFGVKTATEVEQIFFDVNKLKEEIIEFGRIWKTQTRPPDTEVHTNDVWIDPQSGKLLYYTSSDTWVEITY